MASTIARVTNHARVADRPPTGEEIQDKGTDGVQRAKHWLDATCRAEVLWYQPRNHVKKLQFMKMGAPAASVARDDYFSFDLGGLLAGGDDHGQHFAGEVKNYSTEGGQGPQYRQFLANAYCTEMRTAATHFDHYMWITWYPFLIEQWAELLTPNYVATALTATEKFRYTALGSADVDPAVVADLAPKLMVVVLGDRQEKVLRLQGDELTGVQQALVAIRKKR